MTHDNIVHNVVCTLLVVLLRIASSCITVQLWMMHAKDFLFFFNLSTFEIKPNLIVYIVSL